MDSCRVTVRTVPEVAMRVRVYEIDATTDSGELQDRINALIHENEKYWGVLDTDLVAVPDASADHGYRFVVVVKHEGVESSVAVEERPASG